MSIYANEKSVIFQNMFYDSATGELLSPVITQSYTVIQVAESSYNGAFAIDSHRQYCDIELTYVLAGSLTCKTDARAFSLGAGELHLSFKGDDHSLFGKRGCRFQTLAVNFSDGPRRELLSDIRSLLGTERAVRGVDLSAQLAAIVSEFVPSQLPHSEAMLDSLITSVMVALCRKDCKSVRLDMPQGENVLPMMINYIDASFLDICALSELSLRFGYTYSHICKLFRKTYGISPGDYLTNKKMEYARSLLLQGKSVGEVAEKLGYSTPYNFSRAFKKSQGVPPGAIINKKNIVK